MKIWGDTQNLDILFVNTPLSDYSRPHPDWTIFWPPMGLAYMASYLNHKGYRVAVWDAEIDKQSPEQIAQGIAELSPRWAGFNTFTPAIGVLQNIVDRRGEIYPDTRIMLGGVHATVRTEHLMNLQGMEDVAIIQNDGEKKAELLLAGAKPEDIPGVAMRFGRGGGFQNEESLEMFVDINAEETQLNRRFVPYDPTISGNPLSPDGKRRAFISASRGCPYDCTFCASSRLVRGFGKYAVRYRESGLVVAEMRDIIHHDVKDMKLNDDLGWNSKKRIHELFEPIVGDGYGRETGLEIRGNGRANIIAKVDDVTLDLMAEVGVRRVSMGAEQGTEAGMNRVKKDTTPEQIITSCERLAEREIATTYNFMYGMPRQDEKETKAEVALATRALLIGRERGVPVEVDAYRFKPFPGTQEFNDLLEAGFKEEDLTAMTHVEVGDGDSLSNQIETVLRFSNTPPEVEDELGAILMGINNLGDDDLRALQREFPVELYAESHEGRVHGERGR